MEWRRIFAWVEPYTVWSLSSFGTDMLCRVAYPYWVVYTHRPVNVYVLVYRFSVDFIYSFFYVNYFNYAVVWETNRSIRTRADESMATWAFVFGAYECTKRHARCAWPFLAAVAIWWWLRCAFLPRTRLRVMERSHCVRGDYHFP